jgi:signal transduction histidine kinase
VGREVVGKESRSDARTNEALLASRVDADRTEILDAYLRGLEAVGSAIASDPVGREQALAHGEEILADLVASLSSGSISVADGHLARQIGETRASRGLHPQESLRAAIVFYEVVYSTALSHLDMSERSRRLITFVAVALNRSISVRIREAATSYQAFLLDKVRDAHIAERHRIARELHDRVGGGLSTAQRQLELHEMLSETDPVRAATRLEIAKNAIVEAIDSLRDFMSDLRTIGHVTSIEKALLRFLDSAPADSVDIRLRVSGDETWASPVVCDETYLILREATRNALTHGQPSVVAISVNIAPHELRASVVDDGHGFDQAQLGPSGGGGMSSMRERAVLLGGRVTLFAEPGRGTNVELFIPLPGQPGPT